MVTYKVLYSKAALKDAKKLSAANLAQKAQNLIALLQQDPFTTPPPYEKLTGNLKGSYSRRINLQHRMVYQVKEEEKIVRILRMWTHYEEYRALHRSNEWNKSRWC